MSFERVKELCNVLILRGIEVLITLDGHRVQRVG